MVIRVVLVIWVFVVIWVAMDIKVAMVIRVVMDTSVSGYHVMGIWAAKSHDFCYEGHVECGKRASVRKNNN